MNVSVRTTDIGWFIHRWSQRWSRLAAQKCTTRLKDERRFCAKMQLCSALTEWRLWVLSGRKRIDPLINYGQNKTIENERLVEHENRHPNRRRMGPFYTQIGADLSPSRKLFDGENRGVVHSKKSEKSEKIQKIQGIFLRILNPYTLFGSKQLLDFSV